MRGESFFFAWMVGVSLAFIFLDEVSSATTSAKELIKPLAPFIAVLVMGMVFGGVANVFLAQSIPAAPNAGLPWAIFSVNTPVAYLVAYWASKVSPSNFPAMEFSWVNFGGIIVLAIGLVLVMYRPS